MVTQASVDHALLYQPVPQDRGHLILTPVLEGLARCGFIGPFVRPNHVFTTQERVGLKVHQAAFTDSRRWDVNTSGVNFYYYPGQPNESIDQHILERLAVSGAPFNLIGADEFASLYYLVSHNGHFQGSPVERNVPYANIPDLLAHYGADIEPKRIYRVKQGIGSFVTFSDLHPFQLRLFAVDVTSQTLVKHFSRALNTLRSARGSSSSLDEESAAVQLLAAVILAHKEVLGDECSKPGAPLSLVLTEARKKFPRYFSALDLKGYGLAAERAYAILQEVLYSSFTPDMLEAVYHEAYPVQERRWEGRYNTPIYLTQRIFENIPIEAVPPAQRVVVDATCGIGNFLQAAYERLLGLSDMQDSGRQLREHIFGNDVDKLTARLAALSLLLTSLSDQWQVDYQDALQWKWPPLPTVIVGNPPFFGSRKAGEAATEIDGTGKARRYEKAVGFFQRAILHLAPGGYLAMVMPQSFVVSQAATPVRRLLLEQCDVLEIWELPNRIFRGVKVQPMVLFAQRRQGAVIGHLSPWPVRIRALQREGLADFKKEGLFTVSGIVSSQTVWGEATSQLGPETTHAMEYKTVLSTEQWAAIQLHTYKLKEVAEYITGATIGNPSRWPETDYPDPQRVSWLPGPLESMPLSHHIRYGSDTVVYPNELERPRLDKRNLLAGDKVLLTAHPPARWGQRAKVAIERKGYYPSHKFWVLVPRKDRAEPVSLEVLAAVVGWYVSNAWIIEHLRTTKILSAALSSIPFPSRLSTEDCRSLEAAVHWLENATQLGQNAPDARQVIDHVLRAAYQLDDATFHWLKKVAEWGQQSELSASRSRPNAKSLIFVTGGVEDVDTTSGAITAWIDGVPGLLTTRIADEMPGWMLRPGALFKAEIPEDNYRRRSLDDVIWTHLAPLEYSYLNKEDVLDLLDRITPNNTTSSTTSEL